MDFLTQPYFRNLNHETTNHFYTTKLDQIQHDFKLTIKELTIFDRMEDKAQKCQNPKTTKFNLMQYNSQLGHLQGPKKIGTAMLLRKVRAQ